MSKQLVFLDHDGGVDDFLATLLLLTMAHVELLGIAVTPADCYLEPAVNATRKILDLTGNSHIPVAASTVRGLNAFPKLYRRDSFAVDCLPILNERDEILAPLVAESGQAFTVRVLRDAPAPVTVLATGPLSNLAAALDMDPAIAAKIQTLVWMGGALEVPGNVEKSLEPGQDGSAEWNAYWDPLAVAQIWQTDMPIVLCSLDVTNTVPVTPDFVRRLAKQRRYPLSDLAGQCYAITIPQDYYAWDVLATGFLGAPHLYQLQEVETAIATAGLSQGRTYLQPGGRRIQRMAAVDREGFFEYVLQQWARGRIED